MSSVIRFTRHLTGTSTQKSSAVLGFPPHGSSIIPVPVTRGSFDLVVVFHLPSDERSSDHAWTHCYLTQHSLKAVLARLCLRIWNKSLRLHGNNADTIRALPWPLQRPQISQSPRSQHERTAQIMRGRPCCASSRASPNRPGSSGRVRGNWNGPAGAPGRRVWIIRTGVIFGGSITSSCGVIGQRNLFEKVQATAAPLSGLVAPACPAPLDRGGPTEWRGQALGV